MRAAYHRGHPGRPQQCGQFIGLIDLGAVGGDGGEVESGGQRPHLPNIGYLEVVDPVGRRRHAGEGQQAQTGQGSDDSAPFYKSGQGEAQAHQLTIANPHPAHSE